MSLRGAATANAAFCKSTAASQAVRKALAAGLGNINGPHIMSQSKLPTGVEEWVTEVL
jgi:hypothetical protein